MAWLRLAFGQCLSEFGSVALLQHSPYTECTVQVFHISAIMSRDLGISKNNIFSPSFVHRLCFTHYTCKKSYLDKLSQTDSWKWITMSLLWGSNTTEMGYVSKLFQTHWSCSRWNVTLLSTACTGAREEAFPFSTGAAMISKLGREQVGWAKLIVERQNVTKKY